MTRRLILLVLLSLTACRGEQKPQPARAAPSPSPKPVTCPLTGQQKPHDFPISRPPLAIKIDNARNARPQAGLGSADIVYEELAEGGITRFMAIFHCGEADDVGPVRSARNVDPEILTEYAPVLFAYSGANPQVRAKIEKTTGVTEIRYGKYGDRFERRKGRPAPANLFTKTEELRELGDIKGPPKTGLVFQATTPTTTKKPASPSASPTGSPAPPPGKAVSFSYAGGSPVRYTYDEGSGSYLRFQGDTPHNGLDGFQISATNVVVMKVKVEPGTIRDASGNLSPEISVIGSGEVTVLSRGLASTGKWARAKLSDLTTLTAGDGKAIPLAPGRTWIHLVPTERPISIE